MSIGQIIAGTLSGSASDIGAFVGALSLIGGVSMSLVQAVKDLSPFRRRYQRAKLLNWVNEHIRTASVLGETHVERLKELASSGEHDPESSPETRAVVHQSEVVQLTTADGIVRDIESLAVDGDPDVLYDMDAEGFAAQINVAFQMALDDPSRHESLLIIASAWASPKDLDLVTRGPVAFDNADQAVTSRQFAAAYGQARLRVAQQLQRAVDALRLKIAFRWRASMQISALCVAVVLVFTVVVASGTHLGSAVLMALVAGPIAGFLAPVARDVVAAIQKLRT